MFIIKHPKSIINFILLIVGIVGVVNLQKSNLNSQLNVQDTASLSQREKLLQTSVALQKQLPELGIGNLIADWNYLKFIQYFGDYEARQATGYSLVTDYFEAVLKKDPHFTEAFLSFSTANSLFAARPDKTVDFINRITESASPELPGYPFLLWTYKATDEILFLGDLEAAKNSYEQAAKWAKARQDELGDKMAERYEKTAAFLATNPDSTQAQIGAWMNILSTTTEPRTAEYIISRLQELGVTVGFTEDGQLVIDRPEVTES